MKMNYKISLMVMLLSQVFTAQNLISNGNFESEKTDWGGFNNQVLNDDLVNSNVGNINNGEGSFIQVFSMTPEKTYKVGFNFRWVSGSGNYNMTVRIKSGATDGDDIETFTLNTNPDVWYNATFTFTAPAGVSEARIVFFKINGNRPLRIDNVAIIDEDFQPDMVDTNTPINSQPNGVPGDWTLDFSDEFQGDSLDETKWFKSISTRSRAPRANLGVTDWRWIADNAFLNDNGQLVLRATKVNGSVMRCGSVESKGLYEVKYGYLEAKIKIATTAKGNHTAFWLQGANQVTIDPAVNIENSAADGAEIDIFESAWTTNTTKAVVHYDGYSAALKKNHTKEYNTPNIHDGEFHTFGLLWTENEMYIYYDGKRVVSNNSSKPFPFNTDPLNGNDLVPKVKEWLWLSVGASFGDGDFQSQPVGVLSDALVEYVRIYKPTGTLNVIDNTLENDFLIYPNPVKNVINIKSIETNYTVSIFDINGRELYKDTNANLTIQIFIDNYPKGVYYLKIDNNNNTFYKKILF